MLSILYRTHQVWHDVGMDNQEHYTPLLWDLQSYQKDHALQPKAKEKTANAEQ